MHVDTIMESRDATFFENIFPLKDMHSNSKFLTKMTPQPAAPIESSELSDKHEYILEKNDSEAPRRSKRQRIVKSFGDDFTCTLSIAETYASPDADD